MAIDPEREKQRQESIKASKRRYAERNRGKYKTLSITQSAEQTEADRATLAEHGTTVLAVWRAAMKNLREQPIYNTKKD